MSIETPFAEVLEAADRLSLEDQESVVEILHRRIVERRREELAREIREAEEEFRAGKSEPRSAQELMKEILG
ncbi:MAG TPA: hypothetical protein VH988_34625 [Thermoanaerobaculia bacterium]|jgi:hypothetical protein|nr:hypothetical protein [Thermoanaerobaculia bacterium]